MQSFRFHVFLAVVFCVVAFSAASRLLVANSSFDPLHDHFSEVLARHAARELRASPVAVLKPFALRKVPGFRDCF